MPWTLNKFQACLGSLALCDKGCTFPFLDPCQNGPSRHRVCRPDAEAFAQPPSFLPTIHRLPLLFYSQTHSEDSGVSGPLHRSRPSCRRWCFWCARLELECEPTFCSPLSSAVSRRPLLSNALLAGSSSGSRLYLHTHSVST